MINETNQLSEREREILQLVATGLSNQQIANQLGISINTVKVHLRNVFGKIGVASRTEATMYAVRAGIVTIDRAEQTIADQVDDLAPPSPVDQVSVAAPDPAPITAIVSPQDEAKTAPEDAANHDIQTAPVNDPVPVPVNGTATTPVNDAAPAPPAEVIVEPRDRTTTALPQPVVVAPPRSRSVTRNRLLLGLVAIVVILGAGVAIARGVGVLEPITGTQPSTEAAPITRDETRWQTLRAMQTPRAAFATANLGDFIYLIGGENQTGVLQSVERYDPRSATWTALSSKPTAVTDVRAAVLGGKIYVPGGRTAADPHSVTTAFERYDPATETWETLPDLPAPRSAYALAAVEGTLYLFGGWDGTQYKQDVFAYDPDREAWQTRTPMPTARGYMDASVVDGGVYVLGGENESGKLTSNEVYTPSQEGGQPWSRRAPLPKARSRFSMAAASSIIHIMGGEGPDVQPIKYNARTDSWQTISFPPATVGSQPGAVLLDESVIALGGKTNDQYSTSMQSYQAIFTIFNPVER